MANKIPDQENLFLVEETPEIYNEIVLPFITSQIENRTIHKCQWMFDLLEHRSNSETLIVHDDPHPEKGFVLIRDKLWDGSDKNIYLLAIVNLKGIKCLRDLNAEHIPLLENILASGSKIIEEKYRFRKSQMRIYFHYHPSYYHLHVHFCPLNYNAPGSMTEKAHLLQSVISNIKKNPNHYQETTLYFRTRKRHKLYQHLFQHGYVFA